MATLTLAGSPASVGAVSGWSGYESAYGEVRYTSPGVDGGYVTFDLSAAPGMGKISGAHLGYSVSGGAGARHVRFAGTSTEATDANILKRLQSGERLLRLYFSFRAAGGTGGEGSFLESAVWSDISLSVEYEPAGGVSGTVGLGGGRAVGYSFGVKSVLRGESAAVKLDLSGVSDVFSVTVYVSGGENEAYDEATAAAGGAPFADAAFTLDNASWQGRTGDAYIKLRLDCAHGVYESVWTLTDLKLCESYAAPAINCVWSDVRNAQALYGDFVQTKSALKCACAFTCDAGASVVSRSLSLGGVTYQSGTDEFDIGPIDLSGSVPYIISVTDSHGLTGTYAGALTVLPYAAPGLTGLGFERYRTSIDALGQPVYEADDGGRAIRVSLAGGVSALNGHNAWTLTAEWTDGESQRSQTLLSGADGRTLSYERDRSLFTYELSEQSDWFFTLTLTDGFESAAYEFTVPKAGGIFNIERGGVAVGMRSTGTSALPKFEVSFPAAFYSEVEFRGMDSGWQAVPLQNASAFDVSTPVYARAIGDLVYVRGAIKLDSALPSGAAGSTAGVVRVGTLGSTFLPAFPLDFAVVPERSEGYLRLRLDTDGSLTLYNRCALQMGTGAMIPLNFSYLKQ